VIAREKRRAKLPPFQPYEAPQPIYGTSNNKWRKIRVISIQMKSSLYDKQRKEMGIGPNKKLGLCHLP